MTAARRIDSTLKWGGRIVGLGVLIVLALIVIGFIIVFVAGLIYGR